MNRFRPKKFFRKIFENFRFFGHFWPIFDQKNRFFEFFEKDNFKNFFSQFIRIALRSFCAIARFPAFIELNRLTRFIEFLVKNSPKSKVKYIFLRNGGSKNFETGVLLSAILRVSFCTIKHVSRT